MISPIEHNSRHYRSATYDDATDPGSSDDCEMPVTWIGYQLFEIENMVRQRDYQKLRETLQLHNMLRDDMPVHSALLLACATPGLSSVVKLILDDPNAPDCERISTTHQVGNQDPLSAIHYAADIETTRVLLDHNCPCPIHDRLPLIDFAFCHVRYHIIDAILERNPAYPINPLYLSGPLVLSSLSNNSISILAQRLPRDGNGLSSSTIQFLAALTPHQKVHLFDSLEKERKNFPILAFLFFNIPSSESYFWDRQMSNTELLQPLFAHPRFSFELLCTLLKEETLQFPDQWLLPNLPKTPIAEPIVHVVAHCFQTAKPDISSQQFLASLIKQGTLPRNVFINLFKYKIPNANRVSPALFVEMSNITTYNAEDFSHLHESYRRQARWYLAQHYGAQISDAKDIAQLCGELLSLNPYPLPQEQKEIVLALAERLPMGSIERSKVFYYATYSNLTQEELKQIAGRFPKNYYIAEESTINRLLLNGHQDLLVLFSEDERQRFIENHKVAAMPIFYLLLKNEKLAEAKALEKWIGIEQLTIAETILFFLVLHDKQITPQIQQTAMYLNHIVNKCSNETIFIALKERFKAASENQAPIIATSRQIFINLFSKTTFSEEQIVALCEAWIFGLLEDATTNKLTSWDLLQQLLETQPENVSKNLRTKYSNLTFFASYVSDQPGIEDSFKSIANQLFYPLENEQATFQVADLRKTIFAYYDGDTPLSTNNPLLNAYFKGEREEYVTAIEHNNAPLLGYLLGKYGWPTWSQNTSSLVLLALKKMHESAYLAVLDYIKLHPELKEHLKLSDSLGNNVFHYIAKCKDGDTLLETFAFVDADFVKPMINAKSSLEGATPIGLYLQKCAANNYNASYVNLFVNLGADLTIRNLKGQAPIFALPHLSLRRGIAEDTLKEIYTAYIFKTFPLFFPHTQTNEENLAKLKRIAFDYSFREGLLSFLPSKNREESFAIVTMLWKIFPVLEEQSRQERTTLLLEHETRAAHLFLLQQSETYYSADEWSQKLAINFNSTEIFAPILERLQKLDETIAQDHEKYRIDSLLELLQDEDSKQKIRAFLEKIKNQEAYTGTPPPNTPALRLFYNFLENSLKRVVYFCKNSLERDNSEENKFLIEERLQYLAQRSEYCATAAVWASFECIEMDTESAQLTKKDEMARELYLMLTDIGMKALNDLSVHAVGQGYQLVAERYNLLQFPQDSTTSPLSEPLKTHVYDLCSPLAIVARICNNPSHDDPILSTYRKESQDKGDFDTYFDENGNPHPVNMLKFLEEQGIFSAPHRTKEWETFIEKSRFINRHKVTLAFAPQLAESAKNEVLAQFASQETVCKIIKEMSTEHSEFSQYNLAYLYQAATKQREHDALQNETTKKVRLNNCFRKA